ncbi:MAG: hypothetical protein LBU32_24435 [Clostridiales bacterium]|jgi:uncharacterized membrane protein YcgQ (UPF0703/DUF1980 family)|nr:hypothetical protein [Clostridiales bacterium]
MKKTMLILAASFALAACAATACGSAASRAATDSSSSKSLEEAQSLSLPTAENVPEPEKTQAPAADRSGEVVEIKEKLFIAQTNDIYYNPEDYFGKTITYEGLFDIYEEPGYGVYYYVIRYGPGCCGNDANAGFEVKWDKGYPAQDDWVRATGVLESYEEEGYQYLRLSLSTLDVLDVRGAEVVTQ